MYRPAHGPKQGRQHVGGKPERNFKGVGVRISGHPPLKNDQGLQGGGKKTAVEHIKVDAGTMKIKVYKLNDSGDPGDLLVELEIAPSVETMRLARETLLLQPSPTDSG